MPSVVPMTSGPLLPASLVSTQWLADHLGADKLVVVDATVLAPRSSLVRIATGQDASETAFLSQHGAPVDLRWMAVTAVVDELPTDDLTQLVALR